MALDVSRPVSFIRLVLVSLKMCVIGILHQEGIWSELFRTQQFIYHCKFSIVLPL